MKDASYIPHFDDFERQGMIASVVLKVLPKRLREVIGHRSMMEKKGQTIVKNLLLGMLELRKFRMTLRDIRPTKIALSEDSK